MMNVDLTDMELTTARPAVIEIVHEGVPMLSTEEARQIVKNINGRFEQSRKDLIELHDREGWRALGYDNWRDCVQAEFQQSAAYLYRQLAAAKIEQLIESPIGEIPESHLRPVIKAKLNTQETIKQALTRADQLAGDGPRTAKHIEAAAKEIAQPDLPLEFAIAQRRLAALGYTLGAAWDGVTQRFVVRKDGGTGVVMTWPDVVAKLARLEAEPHDAPDHGAADNASAYDQKAARDAGRMERARNLITAGEFDAARTVLDQIEVATYARDQMLTEIARLAAQQFLAEQRDRLTRFSQSAMVSQATFKAALDHIQALIEATE